MKYSDDVIVIDIQNRSWKNILPSEDTIKCPVCNNFWKKIFNGEPPIVKRVLFDKGGLFEVYTCSNSHIFSIWWKPT